MNELEGIVPLAGIPLDPTLDPDPGTMWHPRADKQEARDQAGNLKDLSDDEVEEHFSKPEVSDQIDAGRPPLAAEDSVETPDGEV